jgi:hypothetical protein
MRKVDGIEIHHLRDDLYEAVGTNAYQQFRIGEHDGALRTFQPRYILPTSKAVELSEASRLIGAIREFHFLEYRQKRTDARHMADRSNPDSW